MRALIQSLAGGDPPVTVLLTSHNLAEVAELCARVAVISRGRIRAIDTPKRLRDTHRQTERVELSVRDITRERARDLLAASVDELEIKEDGATLHVAFTRESGDRQLDAAVRALQESGATLLSFDSERATLLDVLESYEREQEEAEEQ